MRYTGPKHKLARREGVNILEKTSRSLDRRINIPPGIHGKRRARKLSEYGTQLREKQKLKRIYGLSEKQFRRYVILAQKKKANTEDALVEHLETRLDNIIYRLGFGKTRAQARQMVAHRHVFVNGKKINIPSYAARPGDLITLTGKFIKDEIKVRIENLTLPSYLERENFKGKVLREPISADVANPINYQLVIEFYSR
ncbi:MAG: 30S ribosomal protein S4 [Candidatus Levybacteria bacterium RIFCSPHIGHO2_02_FULL_40_18]|nr:MAG: 30S ribosomal protein S4 [Candidatus Levybacteria bacterium RIFCSPHIGHO2_01_FULL_40_58]OGH26407.1 MAG: 30S ribosomal protein S4 [Candidatus Levybacteria bacterium RIFCSPHIGHO2_02_FULL_40_18]OGH31855.1 MAG: 30S ribosomal protein S4 [Candidatus Levybacteria bacterium RIFCSPHIGHO2_12_FULL_40_31]OGH40488.1 MAG: 30S ribosomal protein S4 [Candidatus Levybacteria bacterium RIFCSPLOWO2_01_FULL_40_64]OGH49197.1 MAG: 30S ribosomal protein S4 [Candidatus Levybacteria bacterium RIFCSPLOWO2_02_FULL_